MSTDKQSEPSKALEAVKALVINIEDGGLIFMPSMAEVVRAKAALPALTRAVEELEAFQWDEQYKKLSEG